MNRIELVEKLAEEHDLTKAGASRILDSVFSSIIAAVKKGEDASFVGFGTFKQAKRAARKGHNPATGEAVKIPASKVPKFTPGTAFRNAVDPKRAARKAAK
jgi:DNA-binding protein HU-beta